MLYKTVAVTDQKTTCELCGKTGLRKTIVLVHGENGDQFIHVGSECAGKLLNLPEHARTEQMKRIVRELEGQQAAAFQAVTHEKSIIVKHLAFPTPAEANRAMRLRISGGGLRAQEDIERDFAAAILMSNGELFVRVSATHTVRIKAAHQLGYAQV